MIGPPSHGHRGVEGSGAVSDPGAPPQAERVDRLRAVLGQDGLAALVVFDLTNIRYLTGFGGSSGLLVVTENESVLLSDFRYRLRIAEEAPTVRYVEVEGEVGDWLLGELEQCDGPVGVEEEGLCVARWRRLEPALADIETRLVGGVVRNLRKVKDTAEIEALRDAGTVIAQTMAHMEDIPVVGRPERDVALDLEVFARRLGSGPPPFPYIVAGGARGAAPHAETSVGPVPRDGLLVADIGAERRGYASDMTRTFATGRLSDEERRIYDVVRRAQELAREAAAPGLACSDLDDVARSVVSDAGYGADFRHGLGHGVGLEVHEEPRVAQRSTDTLEEGMVITIEPGIYVEGLGGIRIEDTVLVTPSGVDVLTPWEHELVTLR